MRYQAIQKPDHRYPICLICRALNISAAGYDAWRSRPESPRSITARTLLSAIRVIHQGSRETYGSPSIGFPWPRTAGSLTGSLPFFLRQLVRPPLLQAIHQCLNRERRIPF